MVAKMTRIGIIPGQDFDMSKLPPAVAQGLAGAPKAAQEKIMGSREEHLGIKVNGWTYTLKTGAYGTDYLQRAYLTAVDLGANRPQDMLFPATGWIAAPAVRRGSPLCAAFPQGTNPSGQGLLVVDHV